MQCLCDASGQVIHSHDLRLIASACDDPDYYNREFAALRHMHLNESVLKSKRIEYYNRDLEIATSLVMLYDQRDNVRGIHNCIETIIRALAALTKLHPTRAALIADLARCRILTFHRRATAKTPLTWCLMSLYSAFIAGIGRNENEDTLLSELRCWDRNGTRELL